MDMRHCSHKCHKGERIIFMIKNKSVWIQILYAIGLFGMVLLLFVLGFSRTEKGEIPRYDEYVGIDDGWVDKDGNPVDLSKLGEWVEENEEFFSIYYRLPEPMEDNTFFYRSKDVYTRVLVEGEELYQTRTFDARFYNRSPGNLWNSVRIPEEYAGKDLELEIQVVYDANAVTVDHTYLGEKGDIIQNLIKSKLFAAIVSIIVILLGIGLVILDLIPFYRKYANSHEYLYLGLYALLIGVWSILETNIIQIFAVDGRMVQLMDNMVMVTNNMPLILYLDSQYDICKKIGMKIYCYLQCTYILACVVAQFSGFYDMHDLIKGSWIFSYMNDVIMFCLFFYLIIQAIKKRKIDKKQQIQLAGVLFMVGTAFYSALKYTTADGMDRAQYLRVGILGFICCFAISSQLESYRLMQKGMKYKLVKRLAYRDGLTSMRNRTAYLEELDRLVKAEKEQVGVIFLDINDLKQVNDKLGHDHGDYLIQLSAQAIHESFGKEGTVFRIGGDEFCVLVEGEQIEQRYKKQLLEFYKSIKEKNGYEDVEFEIQIAQGFSLCTKVNEERLNRCIAEADGRMYANKAELKSRKL